jgi:hypothetical protein
MRVCVCVCVCVCMWCVHVKIEMIHVHNRLSSFARRIDQSSWLVAAYLFSDLSSVNAEHLVCIRHRCSSLFVDIVFILSSSKVKTTRYDTTPIISMLQGQYQLILIACLLFSQVLSTSVSFSYRTCLPNIDLILLERHHPDNSETFRFVTRNFRLHVIYISSNITNEYQFGYFNSSLPTSANFDYQFQAAIDYYHEVDTWHYVNVTFDDRQEKVFLSFNADETRLIPLMDYTSLTYEHYRVEQLLDEQQTNVSCLLAHTGFDSQPWNSCSIDIKTCGKSKQDHLSCYCSI